MFFHFQLRNSAKSVVCFGCKPINPTGNIPFQFLGAVNPEKSLPVDKYRFEHTKYMKPPTSHYVYIYIYFQTIYNPSTKLMIFHEYDWLISYATIPGSGQPKSQSCLASLRTLLSLEESDSQILPWSIWVMWVKQFHKPSLSHHHFYRWDGYHSQSWEVYDIVFIYLIV